MNPLTARGLHRFYRRGDSEVAALLDVSLTCEPGETVAITGPSGSGKSTLLSLLAGLDEPDGGQVWVGGERLSHRSASVAARVRARSIGLLSQTPSLLGVLSVWENVRLAAGLAGRTPDVELVHRLGLERVKHALPRTLSGGETARAGLAVALATAPTLLLADEPTGEVSATEEHAVLEALGELRPPDSAVVVVTHSSRVAAWAERRLHLVDGRLS